GRFIAFPNLACAERHNRVHIDQRSRPSAVAGGPPPGVTVRAMSKSLINGEGRLKLAIQRNGRLTDDTLKLLHSIGLEFESYGQRLFSVCRNFPLSILYGRDDDIPEYVGLGTVDLGIVGRNLIYEEEVDVEELEPLGFGFCSLVVAVLRDSPYQTVDDVKHAKLATSYPNSARRYFRQVG